MSVRLSSVCVCGNIYPSSVHSFGPISIKLGMDTPWDSGSDIANKKKVIK